MFNSTRVLGPVEFESMLESYYDIMQDCYKAMTRSLHGVTITTWRTDTEIVSLSTCDGTKTLTHSTTDFLDVEFDTFTFIMEG
jgi:hypothetical protein